MYSLFRYSNFNFASINNNLNPDVFIRNITLCASLSKRPGNTPRKPFYPRKDKSQLILQNEYIDIEPSTFLEKISNEDQQLSEKVIELIKNDALSKTSSRKFAIIHVFGKQYKVTTDDLISFRTQKFGLNVGDEILIEKVLMVGSENFSIFGRPILHKEDVSVSATVIEKTPMFPCIKYLFVAKRQTSVMRAWQYEMVVLRINDISLKNVDF